MFLSMNYPLCTAILPALVVNYSIQKKLKLKLTHSNIFILCIFDILFVFCISVCAIVSCDFIVQT